jgi:hypothetical protein
MWPSVYRLNNHNVRNPYTQRLFVRGNEYLFCLTEETVLTEVNAIQFLEQQPSTTSPSLGTSCTDIYVFLLLFMYFCCYVFLLLGLFIIIVRLP